MSFADIQHIDLKHLERTPQYIILGFGLVLVGLLLIIAGFLL